MALQKSGSLTPKGTPSQPTRLATKRKRLSWWLEHEQKAKDRAVRRAAAEEAKLVAQAKLVKEKAHAEQEAKRKAARR
jgi:hypothetical protein